MKDKAMVSSGYTRIENDAYFTIEKWCTEALLKTLPQKYPTHETIWEPACGAGHMSEVFEERGYEVVSTDIKNWGYSKMVAEENFLDTTKARGDHIVTNPPYTKKEAEAFVRHAVNMIDRNEVSSVAMLMRNEWDCAAGRSDLFKDCPYYAGRITLLKRPRWFEKQEGDASPRHNYAWFYWSAGKALTNRFPFVQYHDPKDP